MVQSNYKFYFSFENAYCADYTTEKLYNVLRLNIVPVVYSRLKREHFSVPPYSIINVADFRTAKELADYLLYLDRNNAEYAKYFEWKRHYRIESPLKLIPCEICKKLNTERDTVSSYGDLEGWWWREGEDGCLTGNDLPNIVSSIL